MACEAIGLKASEPPEVPHAQLLGLQDFGAELYSRHQQRVTLAPQDVV